MLFKIFRRIFMIMRRSKMKKCGRNVKFDPFSFLSLRTITCGDNVYIGPNAFISSTHSDIFIGSNTIFGPNVSIYGGNHIYNRVGVLMNKVKKNLDHIDDDVCIGSEVWIAGNVVVLSGVTIGDGAIVGAGSVVVKDIEPYTINVGNPCRKIGERFSESELSEHISRVSVNI